MKLNKKGFTLVELLAVIVVLALLMVVAASSIGTALENSKKKSLETEANKILTSKYTDAKSTVMLNPAGTLTNEYSKKDGDFNYSIEYSTDGSITSSCFNYGKYYVTGTVDENGKITLGTVGETECSYEAPTPSGGTSEIE